MTKTVKTGILNQTLGYIVERKKAYIVVSPLVLLSVVTESDDQFHVNRFGTVRARLSGSAGTHNGMRDIVGALGSTEFAVGR